MKIRSPFLTRWAALVAVTAFRLLFATCRCVFRTARPGTSPHDTGSAERYLYCAWHDSLLLPVFARKAPPRTAAGLVSRHQDGSFLAEAMKRMGILPVRGSTSRGGAQAVRQMLDVAQERHIVITPDGPRGPRRRLKNGIVFLASHSGRKIIPTAYACTRAWR
ncbi:MAG: lysophospholipid acyltransferase family protein, partial [Planctomycetaceae bacterium]